jgi:hypothetical protein
MSDDENNKIWTKIFFAVVKTVPSMLIDAELSKQEALAQKEQRFNDLDLIRLGKSIKKTADSALDQLIINY